MNFNVTSGVVHTAQKVVIYGPEGIGKSTIASQFPDPLFIDTEGSTKNMDVRRLPKPSSFTMLKDEVAFVKENMPCKTLVIDTVDWAESLCIEEICHKYSKNGIEDFGYGNGYVYTKEELGRLLNLLEDLIEVGINVVLTAHAQLRKFSQPDEIGEYDRWELKLGKKTSSQTSPLVKEWADIVLFVNYKTISVATDKDGKKFKAQGGSRVMYTQHHPCWDAKNRHGLAECLPFEYSQIAHIFNTPTNNVTVDTPSQQTVISPSTPATATNVVENNVPEKENATPNIPLGIPKALADLMIANKVDEEEIRLAVSQRGYNAYETPIANYPKDFIEGCLIGAWEQMYKIIESNRDLPFED